VDVQAAEGVSLVEESGAEAVAASDTESAPVVRLTSAIFREAVVQRASDIHLEPGRGGGAIRFRVDGVMLPFMTVPAAVLSRVQSRIKILSRLDIADRLRPQDGRARMRVQGRVYDLRISTVPTRDAEKMVVRVLDPQGAPTLDGLALPRQEGAALRRLLEHRDGIVLITGPTGSGKTTTLYAAITTLAQRPINIMTVEDPVEYELKGITQVQVERKRDVTFASALRAALRQDPDVILVGEIRDEETAQIAVRASITGHLVLGTLHANDALGTVARLRDLGLDPALIGDALRGALAQRLVRRVCSACAVPAEGERAPDEREAHLVAAYGVRQVVRSRGCDACALTGFRGRLPVQEVAVVTPELADLIRRGAGARELAAAAQAAGMRTMREVAAEYVRAGLTTLEEVDRVLGEPTHAPTAAAARAAEAAETAETADEPPTVLLVDDDALVRTLARQLLERQGFRVLEESDGASALKTVMTARAVDLIVLDLQMPVLTGRDVLRALRGTARTAGLPVVVLTGERDESVEVALMNEGADDYIRKPIEPGRFVARVRAALRRAGS
jgi:type II secretory ATPase GspE/PulE/Tfp pilus assembly ATPase PilB-like protein/ActR/RegA family two-component response regulator